MVERITDPHKPVHMTPGCYRIPDGHVVPQPPRPHLPATAGEILSGAAGEPRPLPEPERRRALALTAVLAVLTVAAIALGRLLS